MRTYEAACVFKAEEELFQVAKQAVLAQLKGLGVDSPQENDMGVRSFAYPIGDEIQGHYVIFEFTMDPEKAHQIEKSVALIGDLLRILVIRLDK